MGKKKKIQKKKGKKIEVEEKEEEEEEIEKKSVKKSSKKNTSTKKQKKKNKKEKKESKKSPIIEPEEEEEEEKESKKKKTRKEKKPKQKKTEKKKGDKKPKKKNIKEEEEEEDKKQKKKSTNEEENKNIKKVISKSGAVVDSVFPLSNDYHVVLDENNVFNGKYFSCTLNQSNLNQNNNKFYIIQLLQSDINSSYMLFTRWGRVGVRGEFKTDNCSLENGIKLFMKKYDEKTKRGYKEIIIDYSSDDDDEKSNNKSEDNDEEGINEEEDKSKDELHKLLSDKVIEFIKLIYNTNIINQQMKEIGYDSSKMPLGKLAKESLNKGYLILKDIEKELKKKNPSHSNLTNLSSDFFTYIPHDFGFKKMSSFIIDTLEKLKSKIDMIETLKDMKVATKIIEDNKKDSESKIILNYYNQLHCTIKHISKKDEIYSLLEKYLTVKLDQNSNYSYYGNQKLKLLEAYEIKREGEEERYLKNLKNKMLLWHGTRISNFVGILSQGLRIAPPEAPSSGYLFGKGLYFADMSSKSCNYCYPVNNIGLILLCEVALGNIEKRNDTDYQLPSTMKKGNNSIQGVGDIYPQKGIYIEKDIYVPCECPVQNKKDGFWGIMFNEFIVYDVKQVKLRYVLKIQFDY